MTQRLSSDPLTPARITYALYCVGIILPPVVLAGLGYAYVMRGKDPTCDSHLTFLIATFWLGLAIGIAGMFLTYILIGFAILLFGLVWIITRIVTGVLRLLGGKGIGGTKAYGMVAV